MWKQVAVEFTSAETAEASGVSQDLQRNWRRRGFLPERPGPHRVRYDAEDVLRLAALKTFSEAGLSVKTSQRLALRVALTASEYLVRLPGAVTFAGASDPAEAEAWWARIGRNVTPHYIITPLPERDDGPGRVTYYERHDLTDLADMVGQDGSLCALIFDIVALARKVHEGLPRPVLSIEDEQ